MDVDIGATHQDGALLRRRQRDPLSLSEGVDLQALDFWWAGSMLRLRRSKAAVRLAPQRSS